MRHAVARTLILGLLAAGCGKDNTTPTTPTTTSGPTTETFTSNLTVHGSVWRLITASEAGTLTAKLTSATQPATVVGFGVGIRNGTTTGCLLNSAVTVTAGSTPQIDVPVDAGNYCVKIFDVGRLTDPMGFTITIVHP